MAKAGKRRRVDFDTDFDFDAGLDENFFSFDAEPPPDNRRPDQKLRDGVFEGFRSGVANADYAEKFAKDVFPKGFGETLDFAREVNSRSQDLFDSLQKELKPAIKDFKRVATKLVPADLKLPGIIRSTLDEWRDDLQRDKNGNAFSNMGAGELQNAAVSSQLDALFGAQREEAASDRKISEQRYVTDKAIDTKRWQTNLEVGGRTASGIDRMVQYQNTIDLGYKKKNIELQLRQLFAQQDMLKALNSQLQILGEAMPRIVKNTALPEFVKQNNKEFLAEYNRRELAKSVGNSLFGGSRKYLEDLLKNATTKAGAAMKSGASMFMEGLGGVEQFAEMGSEMGTDPTQMLGDIVGTTASQSMMSKFGRWINKNYIKNNTRMQDASFRASNMVANAPAAMNRWREKNVGNYGDGVWNTLSRLVAEVMPGNQTSQNVERRSLNDVFEPGMFTQRTERSITEVIPGYLARILREQTLTRTGGQSADLLVYDWTSNKFKSQKEMGDTISKLVINDSSRDALHNHLNALVDKYDDGTMSPEARRMLMGHIAKSAANNAIADTSQFGDASKYRAKNEDEQAGAAEAAEVMKKFFATATPKQKYELTMAMQRTNSMVANPIEQIRSLSKAGYNEHLQASGYLDASGSAVSSHALLDKYLESGEGGYNKFYGPMIPREILEERRKKDGLGGKIASHFGIGDDDENSISNVMRTETQEMGDKIVNVFAAGFERLLDILEDPAQAFTTGKKWATGQLDSLKGKAQAAAQQVRERSVGENLAAAQSAASSAVSTGITAVTTATNSLKESGFIQKLMASTEGQQLMSRWKQIQGTPAVQWLTQYSKKVWYKKLADFDEKLKNDPEFKAKWDFVKADWKEVRQDVRNLISKGTIDPKKIDAHLAKLNQDARAKLTLVIDALQRFGAAKEMGVPEAGSTTNTGEPSSNPDQEPGSTPEGEPKPFAKGGLFQTDFLTKPKEFFLKLRNGRTQRAVAGEAGDEAVVPVGDGGVQMITPTGERLGLLPLSRDSEGRLSVLSTIFDMANNVRDAANDSANRIRSHFNAAANDEANGSGAGGGDGGGGGDDPETKSVLQQILEHVANIDGQLSQGLFIAGDGASVTPGGVRNHYPSLGRQALNVGGAAARAAMAPIRWAGSGFRASMGLTGSIFQEAGHMGRMFANRCKDIYVEGDDKPRLRKVDILAGKYLNADGTPLTHHSEIKGEIKDLEGNIVITAEEATKLFTRGLAGKAVRLLIKGAGGAASGVKTLFEKVSVPLFKMQLDAMRLAKDTVKGGIGAVYKMLDQPIDIYVSRMVEPALRAVIMKAGGYRLKSDESVIVDRPSKITGAVLDEDDNVALSIDDIRKGITDIHGRPIRTPGMRLIMNTLGAVGAGVRAIGRFQKRAWEATKRIGKGLLGAAGSFMRGIGRGIGGVLGMDMRTLDPAVISAESHNVLTQIRDILDSRLPGGRAAGDNDGDGDKDGSLSDLRAKAAERAKAAAAAAGGNASSNDKNKKKKKDDDGSGLFSGLLDFLKGLLGGGGMLGKAGKLLGLGTAATGAASALAGGTAAAGAAGGAAAATAGTAAATGAAAATGGGLLAGAAGIGATLLGVLTSPVVLGVAAAGLVGYGMYKGFKYLKNAPSPLDQLRIAQYGYDPKNHSAFGKIRELESMLAPVTKLGSDGVTVDVAKVDMKRAASIFDVDMEDKKQAQHFLGWFQQRFKPVYATHVAVVQKYNNGAMELDTSKIKQSSWGEALQAMRFEEGPYDYMSLASPSDGKAVARYVVTATYKSIKDEYKLNDKRSQSGSVQEEKKAQTQAAAETTKQIASVEAQYKKLSEPDTAFSKGVGLPQTSPDDNTKEVLKYAQASVDKLSGELSSQINSLPDIAGTSGRAAAIDAARYKAYGLTTLEPSKVAQLVQLEVRLAEDFDGRSWSGKLPELLMFAKKLFGADSLTSVEGQALSAWLTRRALKVYVAFWGALTKLTKRPVKGLLPSSVSPEEQVALIQQLRGMDIWHEDASPWTGYFLNTLASSVDENITFIQGFIKQKALVEEKKTQVEQAKVQVNRLKESTPSAPTGASPSAPMPGITPQTLTGPSSSMTPVNMPSESATADPTKLGELKSNAPSDVKKIVTDAASVVGVDPALALSTVALESSFKPDAKAQTSSAKGLYQFIDSTWKAQLAKYGVRYGLDPYNTSPLDPMANSLMGAHFIKDNVNYLAKRTGDSNITATDTYAAHFLGPAGAAQLLNAVASNPAASAPDLMPGPAKANQAIFYNGNQPRSVSEVYKVLDQKVVGTGRKFGLDVKADKDPVMKVADTGSSQAGTPGVSSAPVARSRVPSAADVSKAYAGATGPADASTPMRSSMASNPLSRESVAMTARNNQTLSADVMSNTNSILSNQLQILTEIRDILKTGVSAAAPAAPAAEDVKPNQVTRSGSANFTMPALPVSMRRRA